jgi:hypothetical protein
MAKEVLPVEVIDEHQMEVIAPLKPEEKAAADKKWNEKISYFVKLEQQAIKNILLVHWEQGDFAIELEKNSRAYGNRTSKQLADALGVSESSVYYFRRFREKIPKEEVQELADKRLSWRVVSCLLSVDSDKTRKQLVEKLTDPDKDKRITYEQLESAVKSATAVATVEKKKNGEKTDRRSGANPKRTIESVAAMCEALIIKLDDFVEAINEYADCEDEDKKSKMKPSIKEADKHLCALSKKLTKVGQFLNDKKL